MVWKAVDTAMSIATLSMYLSRRALLIEPAFIKKLTWWRGNVLRTEAGLQATV